MTPVVSTHQAVIANQPNDSTIVASQSEIDQGLMSGVEHTTEYSRASNTPSSATADNRAPSKTQVNLAEADQKNGFATNATIVGKHAGFAALGTLPFLALGVSYAVFELSHLASGMSNNYGQRRLSIMDQASNAVTNIVMVGAALTAIGSILSYPLGRFFMAPTAHKTYDTLMPDELKKVADETMEALPKVADETMAAIPKVVQQGADLTLKELKQAHKTIPQMLINTGLAIASLTEGGAKTAVHTVKQNTDNNAQLVMAQKNLQMKA